MSAREVIVLGAGLAGASTAWHLAERGCAVTVLERGVPADPQGSSHGSARIFRYAYPRRLYVDLAVRARAGWDELERLSGRQLIRTTGCVDFGVVRDPTLLAGVLAAAGVEHELLSCEEARGRWPQIAFDTLVLWQPTAGVLDPEATVEAMLRLACAGGRARVLSGWEAIRFERLGSGLGAGVGWRVRSAAGEAVSAETVVVTAGAWLPELLSSGGLPSSLVAAMPPLEVRQEQTYHFPYRSPEGDDRGEDDVGPAWPAFIHKDRPLMAYGLPGGRDAGGCGQKVARYNGGPSIGSARAQDSRVRDSDRRLVVDYVRRWLPGLVPEPYAESTCLFTNTPTEDFVIDARDDVVLVSGCSGHGAKFAPLLGELAADLALGTGSVLDAFQLGSPAKPVPGAV